METYLTRVTDYLLTQSWQIALLVVVIAAVSSALRNKSAHVRYLLWLIVLAKCLVPPLLTVPVAILPQEKPTMPFEVVVTTISEPLELPLEPVKLTPAPMVSERPAKFTIRQWLGAGWMVGMVAFLVFNLLKALRTNYWLWRKRKALSAELRNDIENLFSAHGVKNFPGVWQIDGISQPFVWGLLRGSIYLPADLLNVKDPKCCRNLLGHELSHVVRFDAAVNFLQVIVQAIFWFHPFVWWANKKIRAEREKCCDEMVIARLNTSPRDYSTAIVETLAAKHESVRPVPSLAVAGPVKNIEERIKTIMKPGKKFYKRPSLIVAIVILVIAFLIVPTALVLTARAETETDTEATETPTTSLHQAAADGDIEKVKSLISKGEDVNAKDEQGLTPLHQAVSYGHRDVAELLIANDADVNAKNERRITPLHKAAGAGFKDIAELLIDNGADVNAKDVLQFTPLHSAAMKGDNKTIELLLSKGADINAKNKRGKTPLFEAMLSTAAGRKEVVELLVAKGAKVPALHLAAYMGDMEKIKKCLQDGIDINSQEDVGSTALHAAASSDKKEIVEFLISKGAKVDAKDVIGWTPLLYAATQNYEDIADLLLAKGADVNAKDKYGITLLTHAIFADDKDAVKLLISKGATVNVQDTMGYTPLVCAIGMDDKELVELLINKGADLNAKDEYGRTALHWAAKDARKLKSVVGLVGLLLARGAEVNAKTKEGKTPLSLAKEKGHTEIIELLRKHGAKE